MKTKSHLILITLAATVLGMFASTAHAGPGVEYWQRKFKPVTTVQAAEAVKPNDLVAMACPKCKTVTVSEFKNAWQNGKGPARWSIGSTHSCDNCGGTITVAKGETKDSMQHNCSICGTGAAFCCAASTEGMPSMDMKK